ncbi:hypothetical protein BBK82_32225 [Lentzea guizhouensis]|uniref:Uncharacterized protein n=1 Tax=Lentzea guizhouensis TaxID=1586287 RepID=A0A1B2HQK9_9PSEU|nr:hypothetical protein [Lentzea guizhouensis]ANZ40014.1 hypothetical protein BBK82_32225 [Lentzea guizhouensis]
MNRGNDASAVHFLLSLIDRQDAAAIRRRLGLGEPQRRTGEDAARELSRLGAPRSVLLWMLERDDPAVNAIVFHHPQATDTMKRDILRGVPFGAAAGPLPGIEGCMSHWCTHEEPRIEADGDPIGGLREASTMRQARYAVRAIGKQDWAEVAEADLEQPLPGYARWALSQRIDCPQQLRRQFGEHAKFRHRLRTAGIVELREYVEQGRPPEHVLTVLHLGAELFPQQAAEARKMVEPLVRTEIGKHEEAWAVLAQLLPTFTGTVPELVRTSGAVAAV